MRTAHVQITENDVVALKRSIGMWAAGTRGAVVGDHGDWKLVEVSDEQGQMLDLLEVDDRDLRLINRYPCTL